MGIGIKDDVAKLEKDYGFGCRNAVELAPWAASVLNSPRLCYCGVDELAIAVSKLDLRGHRPLCSSFVDWGRYTLNRELAKHATFNAYSYQKIGRTLFDQ